MKRMSAYILILAVAVVIVLLVFQLFWKQSPRDANIDAAGKVLPVTIAPVVRREFAEEISAVGTLTARETSLLSSKVAGTVNRVLVDIGDRVEDGAVVIELDKTNFSLAVQQAQAAFASSRAAIRQAEAQYEQAEKDFRRATELLKEKVIPQSRFDAAEAAFKTAKESVSFAGARHDQAKAALGTALEHLKDAGIRSPINGAVVERNVEIGQAVAPGTQLLRIVDQSYLKADIDLPEGDIGRLAPDDTAIIMVDSHAGEEFPGKVVSINPMVDRQTRTFSVRIQSPNQQGKLMDGMFARVRLFVGKRHALAVPRDALQRLPGSGTYYVFVVEGNKVDKRTVEIGVMNDRFSEVARGLVEDDKVVISGAGRLRSGAEITVPNVTNKD